jgi:hypothetical protein
VTEGTREQTQEVNGMSRRATAWLAWSVCTLTLALIVCAIVLAIKGSDVELVIFPLCLTLSAVVCGLVAPRRPGNAVGWFFLAALDVSPSHRLRPSTPPSGCPEPKRWAGYKAGCGCRE